MPSSQRKRADSNEDEFMEQDELEEPTPSRVSKRLSQNTSSPAKRVSARRSNAKEQSVEVVEDSDEEQEQNNSKKTTRSSETKKESRSPTKRNGKKLAVESEDEDEKMNEVEEVKESGDAAEDDNGEEDEEEEEEEEEEVFVVKDIVKHKVLTTGKDKGKVMFLIRWEGYTDNDNTWEPEENLDSPDLLSEYWKTVPTSKQPRKMQEAAQKLAQLKSPSKRGKSKDAESVISGDLEAAEVDQTLNVDNSDGTTKADDAESGDDDDDELEEDRRRKDRENSEAMMVKYKNEMTWEYLVNKVDTVVRDDDGTLRVSIAFNNGDNFWAPRDIVYEKCPQVMLKFYEDHLRFRSGN